MKDLAAIFATQLQLSADVQVAFDARRRTDPADTVRGRFWLLLDEGPPVVLGEIVYAVAFLTQAHEYVRTAYLKADAEKLLNHLAGEAAGAQNCCGPAQGIRPDKVYLSGLMK